MATIFAAKLCQYCADLYLEREAAGTFIFNEDVDGKEPSPYNEGGRSG
jgi:hypothetical protein